MLDLFAATCWDAGETPTVETARQFWETLGAAWEGWMDGWLGGKKRWDEILDNYGCLYIYTHIDIYCLYIHIHRYILIIYISGMNGSYQKTVHPTLNGM